MDWQQVMNMQIDQILPVITNKNSFRNSFRPFQSTVHLPFVPRPLCINPALNSKRGSTETTPRGQKLSVMTIGSTHRPSSRAVTTSADNRPSSPDGWSFLKAASITLQRFPPEASYLVQWGGK